MSNKRVLQLVNQFHKLAAEEETNNYGGKGPFELPADHKAGMKVTHGGSSCANCKFGEMRDDGPHCNNKLWQKWNGNESRLPVDDPLDYCSDWWEPKE